MNRQLQKLADIHYGRSPANVRTESSDIPIYGTSGQVGWATQALFDGPLAVVARKGTLDNPTYSTGPCWVIDTAYAVLPKPEIDGKWLYYALSSFDLKSLNEATGVPSISRDYLYRIPLYTPRSAEQRKIAHILSTVDDLIEHTEALVAKYRAIKQGLMHDLLTRGVDASGRLRPPREETPDLYRESAAGWVPREWEVVQLVDLVESAVDGPFGSNLKTEHYVTEPAVRVVRLQNVGVGVFDDKDKAFISESHATFLHHHQIVGGDLVVASLGDDSHPIGRACLYPSSFPPGIVKADCFRIRFLAVKAIGAYIMHALNSPSAKKEILRFAQGVTRDRINLGNALRIRLAVPLIGEQEQIALALDSPIRLLEEIDAYQSKLLHIKAGLMQDLLTGRVRTEGD